jgi:hypothetical protein
MNGDSNGRDDNGDGRVPHAELWADGKRVHDAPGKLVNVLVAECVKRGYREILIELGEDSSPVQFARGDERLEMDTMPRQLFAVIKERLARLCGSINEGQGTFTTSLKRTETSAKPWLQVQVRVTFADKSVRLTVADANTPSAPDQKSR